MQKIAHKVSFWVSVAVTASFALLVGIYQSYVFELHYLPKHAYPVVQGFDKAEQKMLLSWQSSKPNTWVDLPHIATQLGQAVRLSEDWNFYAHAGIDFNEIKNAYIETFVEKTRTRGGSTLTQQLVKNIYLTHQPNLKRKALEALFAVSMERALSKDRILELYLNIVEWGEGIYGIKAAARYYFKKDPAHLDAKESAFLAMLLPSPKRYALSFRRKRLTKFALQQVDDILYKMKVEGVISLEAYAESLNTPLPFEKVIPPIPAYAVQTASEAASIDNHLL